MDKGTEINSPTDFISWIYRPTIRFTTLQIHKTMSGVISMESTTGGEALEQTTEIANRRIFGCENAGEKIVEKRSPFQNQNRLWNH